MFSIAIARDQVIETQQPRCRLLTLAVVKQLVQSPITEPCAMHHHVFQLYQPRELTPQGSVTVAESFPQLARRSEKLLAGHLLLLTPLSDIRLDAHQQLTSVGQQLIESLGQPRHRPVAAQLHIVGRGDHAPLGRSLAGAGGLPALVLMQQRSAAISDKYLA